MKIDRNATVGGQPAKVVRDMLRDLGRYDCFGIRGVAEHLQKEWWRDYIDALVEQGRIPRELRGSFRRDWQSISKWDVMYGDIPVRKIPDQTRPARALIKQLLKDGFIEPYTRFEKEAYRCTLKGNAFRMTDFVPRMNRAKAEALLKDVLDRVADINAKAELLHWVTEVRVFGSYLTDTDDLGDLDLAIKMERQHIEGDFVEACINLAKMSGKNFGSYLDMVNFPQLELRRRIKNRSPRISIHGIDELDKHPEWGGKSIYTFVPPQAAIEDLRCS
jgi:predicted nucleotidyltransferase